MLSLQKDQVNATKKRNIKQTIKQAIEIFILGLPKDHVNAIQKDSKQTSNVQTNKPCSTNFHRMLMRKRAQGTRRGSLAMSLKSQAMPLIGASTSAASINTLTIG